ncbi:MAG: adenylate cyclase [Alphaproteobacteria bacterium]|jgi:adenylate cyclase
MTDSKSPSDPDGDVADAADRSGIGRIRLVGFAAAALALIATTIWDSEKLRESVFDRYQSHRPRVVESHPARIVEIDDASLKKYGPWPWSRHRLARLAEGIHARGARAIGFDMIFPEADRHSPANIAKIYPNLPDYVGRSLAQQVDPDHLFSQTIGRLPVVLARVGHHGKTIDEDRHPARIPLEASFTGHPAPPGLLSFGNVTTNLPKLDQAAAGHAVINAPPDADGILRRVPLVVMVGGRPTPTMALEALRVASNADDYKLEAKGGKLVSITIGKRRIPTDSRGALRLHFSPPLAARSVSTTAILDNSLPMGAFRGNVVFIGATAIGLEDVIATPVAGEAFGVDVHAQLVETILTGHWLQRPHWARTAEIILAVLLGLIAIFVLPRLQPKYVILSGTTGLVILVGASYIAFAKHGLLLDPLAPAMVSGAAALSMLCMMFLEADRRRQLLREALTEERVQAAKIAGEMEAAREIQMGMLPSREALIALPPEIDLRALLEPARSIGGDLYDAFLVADGKLFFMIGDVTGKGVPASLFMALSKALTKSALLRADSVFEDAVMTANLEISRENSAEMFVTGVLGLIDLKTGAVALVNAGHDDPILLHEGDPPTELRLEGGPPLCVMEDFPYPVEETVLRQGDMLVLTTDGVTEARDPANGLFGHRRLMETLAELSRPATADDAVSAVQQTVRRFEDGGAAADDLTVMAIRYLGGNG